MKRYFLLLPPICIAVVSCIRSFSPQLADVENDTSIRFPQFFERAAVDVAQPGQIYQLDGVTLRALAIAANDFLSPDHAKIPCEDRQEAHLYRIIRREDVIFIRIDENPEHCGHKYGRFDSGAKYAISTDGRILRRALDGLDESMEPFDGGTPMPGEPGVSPNFDPANLQPLPFMRPAPRDGGPPDSSPAPFPPDPATDAGV
jgi:hypothetical protein